MGHVSRNQRCPKCGGNLFLYNDHNGWYEQCLQCSFIVYLDTVYKNTDRLNEQKTSEKSQVTA
jgi:ribosomal protein S27AE